MVRGSISTGGVKKYPLFHCCQRGRKLIRSRNKNISKRKRLPSMPKGENVGHSGTILSLMSTGCSINPKYQKRSRAGDQVSEREFLQVETFIKIKQLELFIQNSDVNLTVGSQRKPA
jgi:hypothetical protein